MAQSAIPMPSLQPCIVLAKQDTSFVTLVHALASDRITSAAALFLLLLLTSTILGDLLVSAGVLRDPIIQDLALRNTAPGFASDGTFRILGTDQLGRDELSRVVFGARISLSVGLATVLVAVTIGTILGLVAGFYRGRVDDILMRLVDIQMGFPSLLLALAVLYTAGPGFINLILVLGLTRWTVTARVARASVLSLRECAFVEAARSIGATDLRIMYRHLMPNLLSPILVLATLELARAMLSEAALSFLGMGIQPPQASWGLMLSQGRGYMTTAWWLVMFPGIALLLTTLSVNLVAGWMRAVSDPVQRWRWLDHRPRSK